MTYIPEFLVPGARIFVRGIQKEVGAVEIKKGDIFVRCSDGATHKYDASRVTPAEIKAIPAIPIRFPRLELLMKGVLEADFHNWQTDHSGWTLLYPAKENDKITARAHGFPPDMHQPEGFIALAKLKPVRRLTNPEKERIEKQLRNGNDFPIRGNPYRYEFSEFHNGFHPVYSDDVRNSKDGIIFVSPLVVSHELRNIRLKKKRK